ncbi:MAG TPA: transglycosylase domain-containing protein [Segeticoccus sp.]|uniref:transglycosylase domain-containing protein n=1 Tax=Segeticoccus sp. TaxID=2706531 RepID=UPI002D80CFDA|nr:transglycosylase domain-containing protein [Segeticoccus sp.]HET8600125.1 transglycosylase domain-containing protein [Segeticoccus sp.]
MHGLVAKFANVLSLFGAFVATAVVVGLLGAALLIPGVGAVGMTARQGVQMFDSLPSRFQSNPLLQQSTIVAANGAVIATPYDQDRIIVPLSKVSRAMQDAQVAIEDARFFQHGALDPKGVARALASNLVNGTTEQGASTLTQQFVKISLEDDALRNGNQRAAQAATVRQGVAGYERKLQELKYAIALEKKLTKDQILQGYLNIVYYGDQAYGVEAAARHYYGIHASRLDIPQAAMLAGIVNEPGVTDPIHDPQAALQRRNVVLDKMYQHHFIDERQWITAKHTPVRLHVTPHKSTCAASRFPYFCTYVMAWLAQQPALGATVAQRIDRIDRGGLTIRTTLDPRLQDEALRRLRQAVPANRYGIAGAAVVLQPGTGHVLAAAQSTRFTTAQHPPAGQTGLNYAVDQVYGGSGGFQFGSAAKTFAVVTALKQGMSIHSNVYARPASASKAATFTTAELPGPCGLGPGQSYPVFNDEGTTVGNMSLLSATTKSVNTAFVGLDGKLGLCNVRDTMTQLGLHQASGQPIEHLVAPIALGADPVSPMTLADAYATIASDGERCAPVPVLSVTGPDGKKLGIRTGTCQQVLDPVIADGTTAILRHVLTDDGATAKGVHLAGHRPAAGKTGTADFGNATWFVGYTPQLVGAVWVGAPDNNAVHLRNIRLGGTFYKGQVFGATIAAPLWADLLSFASRGLPVERFAPYHSAG